jgi:hypothetical protein
MLRLNARGADGTRAVLRHWVFCATGAGHDRIVAAALNERSCAGNYLH